jgi:bifunctional UDP-N-acetylglucosamine pyrophosphorylase/glucosamine-1-phosphate N-acetyltransferase
MKSSLPKVLHQVLGRAILSRVLDALDRLGLEHVYVVVGHGAEDVRRFLENNPPATPWSAHLQEPQLGTGHAVQQVANQLLEFEGTLLVSVADTPLLTAETLSKLIETHQHESAVATLLSTVVADAKSYGRIVRDSHNKVERIVEDKDATAAQKAILEINTAIYCLEWPAVQEGLMSLTNDNEQKEYYLTDLIGWATGLKRDVSAVIAEDWREVSGVNSRVDLAEVNRLLRERTVKRLLLSDGVTVLDPDNTWIAPEVSIGADSIVYPGCLLTGDVSIGEGCTIGPQTTMFGPVKVGDHTTVMQSLVVDSEIGSRCRVGPFAHLREGTRLSDSVRVGNFVEVKKSEVGAETNVSHLSYIGDAEIGSRTNVGAGTITANYDHVTKSKERTVIADDVSTGSNSVLVAPVTIGSGASVAAGTVVTKDVPPGALAVGRARQENKTGWADNKRQRVEKALK